jgi:hypothetical protein
MLSTAACSRQDVGRAPDRTGAHPDATRTQPAANFFHCQVWFGSDQLQQPSLVRIQQRTLAADQLSRHRSGLPPARNPPIAELGTSNAAAASWQALLPPLNAPPVHADHANRTSASLSPESDPKRFAHQHAFENPLRFASEFNPIGLCWIDEGVPDSYEDAAGVWELFFSRGSGKSSRLRRGSGTIG